MRETEETSKHTMLDAQDKCSTPRKISATGKAILILRKQSLIGSTTAKHLKAKNGKAKETAKVILRKQSLTGPTSSVKRHRDTHRLRKKSPMLITCQAAGEVEK
jgi:hypothetical protein